MGALAKSESGAAALLARHPAPPAGSAWAEATREAARSRLAAMGAPGRRDEYWRYTDPTPLTDEAAEAEALPPEPVAVFDEVDALRLVF
ncbi:MAG: Fe-S cluster assembly protein SufD, partial [Pseudomonadota bacterium]